MLLSDRVFKIGSSVKADLTHLRKQFPSELNAQPGPFVIIDLKEHCINHNIIKCGDSGTLETLLEKTMGLYLPKYEQYRKSENWEQPHLNDGLLNYAAMDVYASRLIFKTAA